MTVTRPARKPGADILSATGTSRSGQSGQGKTALYVGNGPIRSYTAMLLAWMFDFQAAGAGEGLVIQIAFAGTYLLAFALFLIGDQARPLRIRGLGIFLACTGLFLITGLVSGLMAEQAFYPLFRHAFSVLVYLTATYATARIVIAARPGSLRLILAWLCAGHVVTHFLIIIATQGAIDFSRVRYQIIGNSVVAGLGYLTLLLMFRLGRIELAALLVNFVLVFLSVTRTFILVAVVQMLPALRNARQLLGPRMLLFALLAVVVVAGILTYSGFGVERWGDRLVGGGSAGGQEVTWLTRTSEWQFMWDAFMRTVDTMLFGNGFAAETRYWLPAEVGGGFDTSIGFGHNQYLSMLFIAGLIGGLPLIAVQLLQVWRAFGFLSAAIRAGRSHSDLLFLGAWGATIVLGAFMANVLSATFGSRGASLWFAIGTGLLLGTQAWFDPANRPVRRERPQPRRPRAARGA